MSIVIFTSKDKCLKGELSRGFLHFGWKCAKDEMKCFFTYTEYTQKVKRRKSIDFLKERTNHSQLRAEKLEQISLMFTSCSHSHPGDPEPNTLNYSLRELVGCFTSISGSPVIRMSFGFSKLS